MDPKLLNPGFRQVFRVDPPATEQESAALWERLASLSYEETYTSNWSQVELGGVYGLIPWLPERNRDDYPSIYVGTPAPAGTRGYRGVGSNVILHDLRDRMVLSLFDTHVRNHMPGHDETLNVSTASALQGLVKETVGADFDSSLFMGAPRQAPMVVTSIFNALACGVAATSAPRVTDEVPEEMFRLLDDANSYLGFALSLAQMWRRLNSGDRRGQVFSAPRSCVTGDLFMAAHETAHMFARGALPAEEAHLRDLAASLAATPRDGLLGEVMTGAARAVADDQHWSALLNEVSADYAAHAFVRGLGDQPEAAAEALAHQGAVAWMAGCRSIGLSSQLNFDHLGSALLRFYMALIHWSHLDLNELMVFHESAINVCLDSWTMLHQLWNQGLNSTKSPGDGDGVRRDGLDLIAWGQQELNQIWNSWWSPSNRASMRRATEMLPLADFDFLDL